MSKFEKVQHVGRKVAKRAEFDGVVATTSLALLSPLAILPVGAGLMYGIRELCQGVDPDAFKMMAVGVIGLAELGSIALQSHTLRKHKYCASPASNTAYVAGVNPEISSTIGHISALSQWSIMNPTNIFAMASHDERLLLESSVAVGLSVAMWISGVNTLILKGKAERVTNKIKTVRHDIWNKVRGK